MDCSFVFVDHNILLFLMIYFPNTILFWLH